MDRIVQKTFFLRASLGVCHFIGARAIQFLQGQTTCNMSTLVEHQGLHGACCNNKGRVLSIFTAIKVDDGVICVMDREIVPLLIEHLKKYAVFHQVSLHDVSQDYSIIELAANNPENKVAAVKLIEQILPKPAIAELKDHLLILIREENKKAILEVLSSEYKQQSEEEKLVMNMEKQLPRLHPETYGQFTAHQLNLPDLGYVDFHKGCYTGQEIVARTHHLGKIKQSLSLIEIPKDNIVKPNEKIEWNGKTAKVVDYYYRSNSNHTLLLVLL